MEEIQQWIFTLIANKDYSDVELHVEVVNEKHTFVIPAHSMVLKRVSKVFETMLEPGKFKEGTTRVVQIKVLGTKADAVTFIKYLYTKKLQTLDMNSYVALMLTADVYQMNTLREMCEKRIRTGLTPFLVCGLFNVLQNVSSEEFRVYCKAMMLKFAFLIFGEKLHVTLSEEDMSFLLSSNELNVLDEEQALQATWDWGHSKCMLENLISTKGIKEMVASLLPLIKWSYITKLKNSSELRDLHAFYKELSVVTGPIIVRRAENTISLSTFATFLNLSQHVDSSTISCVVSCQNGTLITFTSDRILLLTGIEMHIGSSERYDYRDIVFSIYVNASCIENISCENTLLTRSGKDKSIYFYTVSVNFTKPVVLRTNKNHSISFRYSCCNQYVQTLNLNKSAVESGILGSDNEVRFSVAGQVAGVQKLFYFLQS